MATISNTPRPGYVWDATDNVWYPIGVGAHQHTNAADTPAVMPYSTYAAAGKNKIINGDFGIWQRGTSGTGTFLADRFQYNSTGADSYTQSRQTFTPGNQISGYEPAFFHRMVISTAAAYAQFSTTVEGVRTLAGQTVTLSFWAKADTNTRNFGVYFDQNFGTGGSTSVTTTLPVASLTTGWVRYTASLTLPNISGKTIGTNDYLNIRLVYNGVGTFDTWGFQLEAGSNATAFQTATGNPASELAACMRYYQKMVRQSGWVLGNSSGTTIAYAAVPFQMEMRVTPTITLAAAGQTSGTLSFLTAAGAYPATTGTHTVTNATVNGFQIDGSGYVGLGSSTIAPFFINGAYAVYTASAEI
jgi:hypothetical protein